MPTGALDLDFLAGKFSLSGGNIRNAVVYAAFLAAGEGTDVEMRHMIKAVKNEYAKYGLVKNSMGGAMETLHRWERIYLEEGAAGFMTERRGRKSTGRPRKQPLDKSVEEDLIAENQRLKERNEYLEMELEYLKKLDALVRAEEERNGRKPK